MSTPMNVRQATRLRLEQSSGVVMFSDLRPHLERNAVFIVTGNLSIVECALAIAMDDVALVEPWIARGALRRPSQRELDQWRSALEKRWRAVVVQPYVLVQDP